MFETCGFPQNPYKSVLRCGLRLARPRYVSEAQSRAFARAGREQVAHDGRDQSAARCVEQPIERGQKRFAAVGVDGGGFWEEAVRVSRGGRVGGVVDVAHDSAAQ